MIQSNFVDNGSQAPMNAVTHFNLVQNLVIQLKFQLKSQKLLIELFKNQLKALTIKLTEEVQSILFLMQPRARTFQNSLLKQNQDQKVVFERLELQICQLKQQRSLIATEADRIQSKATSLEKDIGRY